MVGVGYRPRTGAIFFTRNGKRYEEVVHGLKAQNFFPAIGATGPAVVHVNLGQSGFVFIEANVKKWGLAPVTGSLAPPPPYGSEQGSILLETGTKDGVAGGQGQSHRQSVSGSPSPYHIGSHNTTPQHGRTRSGNFRILAPTSPGPVRSPTDISLAQLVPNDEAGEASGIAPSGDEHQEEEYEDGNPLELHLEDATNPPPDYASPTQSESGSDRRYSIDSDNTPLIHVRDRGRAESSATVVPRPRDENSEGAQPRHPPVPSYSDAVRDGAGQTRRDSSESEHLNESAPQQPPE